MPGRGIALGIVVAKNSRRTAPQHGPRVRIQFHICLQPLAQRDMRSLSGQAEHHNRQQHEKFHCTNIIRPMPSPSVFHDRKSELAALEFQMGVEAGRLAVTLDVLTDALVLVGQHGVYCQSARQPGKPAMDVQMILQSILQAKELIASVLEEKRKAAKP